MLIPNTIFRMGSGGAPRAVAPRTGARPALRLASRTHHGVPPPVHAGSCRPSSRPRQPLLPPPCALPCPALLPAAILLTNKASEARRAKYSLEHVVRCHLGADDVAYKCAGGGGGGRSAGWPSREVGAGAHLLCAPALPTVAHAPACPSLRSPAAACLPPHPRQVRVPAPRRPRLHRRGAVQGPGWVGADGAAAGRRRGGWLGWLQWVGCADEQHRGPA